MLGWIGSADELEGWASQRDYPPRPEVLHEWHSDPDVHHPFLLFAGERSCGYGEGVGGP